MAGLVTLSLDVLDQPFFFEKIVNLFNQVNFMANVDTSFAHPVDSYLEKEDTSSRFSS